MRFMQEVALEVRTGGWRTALAGLAVAVAVSAVVVMSLIGRHTADTFVARDAQINGRALTLSAQAEWVTGTVKSVMDVVNSADERIIAVGGSYAVLSELRGIATAESAQPGDGTVCGVIVTTPGLTDIRRLPLLAGVWLDNGTIGAVVVNATAADNLGGVGTTLRLAAGRFSQPWSARVVGIVSDGVADPRVYVSLEAFARSAPAVLPELVNSTFLIHGDVPADRLTDVTLAVARDLGISPGGVELIPVSQLDGIRGELTEQRNAFVLIGVATSLIAALGLLGIAIAGLRERTRELAIRRALGASRLRIFGTAFCTSASIALVVGALTIAFAAIVLTVLGPLIVGPSSPIDFPTMDASTIAVAIGTSLGVSLIGGLAPAILAARVDPSLLLRV